MSTTAVSARNPRANSTTLGSLWVVYGILRLIATVFMILYANIATVMFGALLTRVADFVTFMAIFHVLYIAAILITALSGLFSLLAGAALLTGKSARTLSLLAAFLSVHDLPLGTTLGIYTLIITLL